MISTETFKPRFLCFSILLLALSATAQTNIARQNPLPGTTDLNAVVWTGTDIFAVGKNGTVLQSSDGVNWSTHSAGTQAELRGLAWSGRLLVAVGNSGTVLTSPDGKTWTSRNGNTDAHLRGIVWADTQFVAVTWNGKIITSSDGIKWSPSSIENSRNLNAITWTGNLLVAIGSYGNLYSSPDAISWTQRSPWTTEFSSKWSYAITWTGKQVFAVGQEEFASSPDGIGNWTKSSFTQLTLNGVYGNDTMIVAVGDGGVIFTSIRGGSWIFLQRTDFIPSGKTVVNSLNAITWADSQLVVVGEDGIILTSRDGRSWTHRRVGPAESLHSTTSNGEVIVAVGEKCIIRTSIDGYTWNTVVQPTEGALYKVIWANGEFLACGGKNSGGVTYSSTNGVDWTESKTGYKHYFQKLAWSGSQYAALGYYTDSTTIFTSDDGITWSLRKSGDWLWSIIWAGNQFVAAGGGNAAPGLLLTSHDGIEWTIRNSGAPIRLLSLAWTGAQIIAVGYNGTIVTSPDGLTWTNRSVGGTKTLSSVVWNGQKAFALESDGGIWSSPDGLDWTPSAASGLSSIHWAGDRIIALGPGRIQASSNGQTWNTTVSPEMGIQTLSDVTWSGNLFVIVGELGTILTSTRDAPNGVSVFRKTKLYGIDDFQSGGSKFNQGKPLSVKSYNILGVTIQETYGDLVSDSDDYGAKANRLARARNSYAGSK